MIMKHVKTYGLWLLFALPSLLMLPWLMNFPDIDGYKASGFAFSLQPQHLYQTWNWHPFLMVLSFSSLLSPALVLFRILPEANNSRKARRCHLALHLCSLVLAGLGIGVIVAAKDALGAPHLSTTHAAWGMCVCLLFGLQALRGIDLAFWAHHVAWLRPYHPVLGLAVYCAAFAAFTSGFESRTQIGGEGLELTDSFYWSPSYITVSIWLSVLVVFTYLHVPKRLVTDLFEKLSEMFPSLNQIDPMKLRWSICFSVPLLPTLFLVIWISSFPNISSSDGDINASGFRLGWGKLAYNTWNWHPLLMTLAYSTLFTQAALSTRLFRKPMNVQIHLFLQTMALLFSSLGLAVIFEFKKQQGFPDLVSTHGLWGFLSYIVFALNYLLGVLVYLRPGDASSFRPWHMRLGMSLLVAVFGALSSGMLERVYLYSDNIKPHSSFFWQTALIASCMFLNIFLVLFVHAIPRVKFLASKRVQVDQLEETLLEGERTLSSNDFLSSSGRAVSYGAASEEGEPLYADQDLVEHRSASSAWLVIGSLVVDVTAFLKKHPGGRTVLLQYAGTDATRAFEAQGHSDHARALLQQYKIGRYLRGSGPPRTVSTSSSHSRSSQSGTTYTVTSIRTISHDVKEFELSSEVPQPVPAGHHLLIQGPEGLLRPYTPTRTDPSGKQIALMIKKYPLGKVSSHIHSLSVGDSLQVAEVVGNFPFTDVFLESSGRFSRIAMLAAGSGLTPMLQVLKAGLKLEASKKPVFQLIYSNKTRRDILLRSELDSLQEEEKRFSVHYTLTQDAEDGLLKGRVSLTMLKSVLPPEFFIDRKTATESKTNVLFLLCGPDGFQKAAVAMLKSVGATSLVAEDGLDGHGDSNIIASDSPLRYFCF